MSKLEFKIYRGSERIGYVELDSHFVRELEQLSSNARSKEALAVHQVLMPRFEEVAGDDRKVIDQILVGFDVVAHLPRNPFNEISEEIDNG